MGTDANVAFYVSVLQVSFSQAETTQVTSITLSVSSINICILTLILFL